ncbi:MAG: glycosyltransferase [Candidatus Omnitrophica bacterium]|nr:glycosyltransferase [Candidatus Omnitrophota bacterium]
MPDNKIAVIIPTKDRPEELGRLLESIRSQDAGPCEVIVVDGGRVPAEGVVNGFSGSLTIRYVRQVPASLTAQRNAGIRCLGNEATLAAFFDDDIVLEQGCLRNMLSFWEKASGSIGAAAFNNITEEFAMPSLGQRIFLVNAAMPGRVLRSGFQSRPYPVPHDIRVQWLPGYAMIFRREVFGSFLFDEKFAGYARYEDVDFSYRVGRSYTMFVVRDAKVRHCNRPEDISFSFSLGKMEIVNRFYFVRKTPELSVALCLWACLGIFLNNAVKGIVFLDRRARLRAAGDLAGFAALLTKGKNHGNI